jgi:hypothetical protein
MSFDPVLFAENTSFRDALHNVNAPMFVARVGSGANPRLEIGTLERRGVSTILAAVQKHLHDRGLKARISVRHHDAQKMRKIRSLEALLASTGAGTLVFDRTKAFQRAETIVALTQRLRSSLGKAMLGAFFAAERRTLFLVLSPAERGRITATATRQAITVAAEAAWQSVKDDEDFDVSLRIGFEVPSGAEVVAVDRQTVRAVMMKSLRNPLKGRFGAIVLGTLAGASVSVPTLAADLVLQAPVLTAAEFSAEPAVDEANLSFGLLGGVARDPVLSDHLWTGFQAKGTLPLSDRFGVQVDLGAATDQYYGAAVHLFARDPAMGLVGIIGSAESQHGVSMNRLGAEVEYYINDSFTVGARVGYQGGTAPNGAFGRLDVKFYPDPNLSLKAGVEFQPSLSLARAGFEWRPALDGLAGLSLSGDGMVTNTGDYRAMFGLHFQIGGSETLLDRDRRSDPEIGVFNKIDTKSAVPAKPVVKGYGPTLD